MTTWRKPPMHDTGREVRGCSITCDDCGDELELRAHGEGVRGDHAREVATAMVAALRALALALGWVIPESTSPGKAAREVCPACTGRAAALRTAATQRAARSA